jgi:hypothetical protein
MWECMVKGHIWVMNLLMSNSMVTWYRCVRCGEMRSEINRR